MRLGELTDRHFHPLGPEHAHDIKRGVLAWRSGTDVTPVLGQEERERSISFFTWRRTKRLIRRRMPERATSSTSASAVFPKSSAM
jgi:hypothetical protein